MLNTKQPFSDILQNSVLKNFVIFTGNTCVGVFFDQVKGLQACNFIKKRLQHGYFLVNIVKFLRTVGTAFSIEHLRWLRLENELD